MSNTPSPSEVSSISRGESTPEPPWVNSRKVRVAYSIGEAADAIAYQSFSFLIFTFYFSVVGVPVWLMSTGYILWSIWNALNDPLIGNLSDRTKTRWGRRIPWMMFSAVPLAIVLVLLYTPPVGPGVDDITRFAYFLIILCVFDFCYTAFSTNHTSLWPEMYISAESRAKSGTTRRVLTVLGLIFAVVFPTFVIPKLDDPASLPQYQMVGLIIGIVVFVMIYITVKWGAKERVEFSRDSQTAPTFTQNLKMTFGNKAFLIYAVAALATWIVYGILPTIIPLYAIHVLHITDSILTGALLLVTFLVGAITMPLWNKLRIKKGSAFTYFVDLVVFAIMLVLFILASDPLWGFIGMGMMGIGLGGGIYIIDHVIAEIIDEDELRHGTRREGGFYGINALVIRLSGVINAVAIGFVFSGTGWGQYTPIPTDPTLIQMGLRFLFGIFPAIVLIIGAISMHYFPIKGQRLAENVRKMAELHAQKREGKEAPQTLK